MTQQVISFEIYSQTIYHLRIKGTRLLEKIKFCEMEMNKRKQQNLNPLSTAIDLMSEMINELVKISAMILTYRYFQSTMLSFEQSLFNEITDKYYIEMLRNIVKKISRLNEDKLVDFTIVVNEKS